MAHQTDDASSKWQCKLICCYAYMHVWLYDCIKVYCMHTCAPTRTAISLPISQLAIGKDIKFDTMQHRTSKQAICAVTRK